MESIDRKNSGSSSLWISPGSKSRYGRTRKPKISLDFCYNTEEVVLDENVEDPPKPLIKSPVEIKNEFTKIDDLGVKVANNFKGHRGLDDSIKERKFFKTTADILKEPELPTVDVSKVFKLISNTPEVCNTYEKKSTKNSLRTYSNKRRYFHDSNDSYVVESFGLPDDPIVPLKTTHLMAPRDERIDVDLSIEQDLNLLPEQWNFEIPSWPLLLQDPLEDQFLPPKMLTNDIDQNLNLTACCDQLIKNPFDWSKQTNLILPDVLLQTNENCHVNYNFEVKDTQKTSGLIFPENEHLISVIDDENESVKSSELVSPKQLKTVKNKIKDAEVGLRQLRSGKEIKSKSSDAVETNAVFDTVYILEHPETIDDYHDTLETTESCGSQIETSRSCEGDLMFEKKRKKRKLPQLEPRTLRSNVLLKEEVKEELEEETLDAVNENKPIREVPPLDKKEMESDDDDLPLIFLKRKDQKSELHSNSSASEDDDMPLILRMNRKYQKAKVYVNPVRIEEIAKQPELRVVLNPLSLDYEKKYFLNLSRRSSQKKVKKTFKSFLKCVQKDPDKFQVGDLAWAKIGHYPFWPCIVTDEPHSKIFEKRGLRHFIHVRFFGDYGRRAWVSVANLMLYQGRNDFHNTLSRLKLEEKYKASLIAQFYVVKPNQLKKWQEGIEEAESLKSKTVEERLKHSFKKRVIKRKSMQIKEEILEVVTGEKRRRSSLDDSENHPKKQKQESPRKVMLSPRKLRSGNVMNESKRKSVEEYEKMKSKKQTVESNSDTDSKFSDNSSVPASLESQAALFRRNNIFRGVSKEKCCQICGEGGEVVKCKGPCNAVYHRVCAISELVDESVENSDEGNVQIISFDSKKNKPVPNLSPRNYKGMSLSEKIDLRMKEIMKNSEHAVYASESTDSCSENEIDPRKVQKKPGQTIIKHVTADDVDYIIIPDTEEALNNSSKDFKCRWCSVGGMPPCLVCNSEESKLGSQFRQKCSLQKCGRFYHPECLKAWPQTQWSLIRSTKDEASNASYDTFVCPRHVCHTCISDDPKASNSRLSSNKVVKCLRCPATYHSSSHCVPAGTQILTTSQVICPRHSNSKKGPINANWCFICSKGGDLICCDTCPTSVHKECLPGDFNEAETFYCEDCESGRLPLYDEIVWVKLGAFRWWPALILFPNEVPDNVRNIAHSKGEFVVKFYGTYDHYWVGRGRSFLFQEGDKGQCSYVRKKVDNAFLTAIQEAEAAHELKKKFKMSKLEEQNSGLKPPPYIKIKGNRPVGNVRIFEGNTSNTTACECDPNKPHPCGPESDCLNRLLLTECNPEVCPAGTRCKNQCFEKREYPPLTPYRTHLRGWGLKTLAPIRKGQFIIEYVGEMIDEQEYQRRVQKMHEQKEENYYFLTIDNNRMLDAGPKGNVARFMNHSCDPNCETQKWTVNGDTRVGLFSRWDIPSGAELTFNYNLECIGKEKKACRCGTTNCSGFIGVKVKPDESLKKTKRPSKKKKRKPQEPQVLPEIVNPCFSCGKLGEVGMCNNKICHKFYHLECVGVTSWPEANKWTCPWHNCNWCTRRTTRCCVKCVNSFCPQHSEGNVRYDKLLGFVCVAHDPDLEQKEIANEEPEKKVTEETVETNGSWATSTPIKKRKRNADDNLAVVNSDSKTEEKETKNVKPKKKVVDGTTEEEIDLNGSFENKRQNVEDGCLDESVNLSEISVYSKSEQKEMNKTKPKKKIAERIEEAVMLNESFATSSPKKNVEDNSLDESVSLAAIIRNSESEQKEIKDVKPKRNVAKEITEGPAKLQKSLEKKNMADSSLDESVNLSAINRDYSEQKEMNNTKPKKKITERAEEAVMLNESFAASFPMKNVEDSSLDESVNRNSESEQKEIKDVKPKRKVAKETTEGPAKLPKGLGKKNMADSSLDVSVNLSAINNDSNSEQKEMKNTKPKRKITERTEEAVMPNESLAASSPKKNVEDSSLDESVSLAAINRNSESEQKEIKNVKPKRKVAKETTEGPAKLQKSLGKKNMADRSLEERVNLPTIKSESNSEQKEMKSTKPKKKITERTEEAVMLNESFATSSPMKNVEGGSLNESVNLASINRNSDSEQKETKNVKPKRKVTTEGPAKLPKGLEKKNMADSSLDVRVNLSAINSDSISEQKEMNNTKPKRKITERTEEAVMLNESFATSAPMKNVEGSSLDESVNLAAINRNSDSEQKEIKNVKPKRKVAKETTEGPAKLPKGLGKKNVADSSLEVRVNLSAINYDSTSEQKEMKPKRKITERTEEAVTFNESFAASSPMKNVEGSSLDESVNLTAINRNSESEQKEVKNVKSKKKVAKETTEEPAKLQKSPEKKGKKNIADKSLDENVNLAAINRNSEPEQKEIKNTEPKKKNARRTEETVMLNESFGTSSPMKNVEDSSLDESVNLAAINRNSEPEQKEIKNVKPKKVTEEATAEVVELNESWATSTPIKKRRKNVGVSPGKSMGLAVKDSNSKSGQKEVKNVKMKVMEETTQEVVDLKGSSSPKKRGKKNLEDSNLNLSEQKEMNVKVAKETTEEPVHVQRSCSDVSSLKNIGSSSLDESVNAINSNSESEQIEMKDVKPKKKVAKGTSEQPVKLNGNWTLSTTMKKRKRKSKKNIAKKTSGKPVKLKAIKNIEDSLDESVNNSKSEQKEINRVKTRRKIAEERTEKPVKLNGSWDRSTSKRKNMEDEGCSVSLSDLRRKSMLRKKDFKYFKQSNSTVSFENQKEDGNLDESASVSSSSLILNQKNKPKNKKMTSNTANAAENEKDLVKNASVSSPNLTVNRKKPVKNEKNLKHVHKQNNTANFSTKKEKIQKVKASKPVRYLRSSTSKSCLDVDEKNILTTQLRSRRNRTL